MPRRAASTVAAEFEPLTLVAATWLACGIVLLGLTPLPLRDATLGWSPAFWLLAAPCLLLAARRAFGPHPALSARYSVRSTRQATVQAIRRRKAIIKPGRRTRPARRAAA